MNHFYVTLPSDSSIKYYPNNTVAHFTTKLPHRIRLDGDYEVGLAEFIYPHSWFNFSKGLSVQFKDIATNVASCECIFDGGQFPSEFLLMKSLNENIGDAIAFQTNRKDLRVIFSFDDVFRKMRMTIGCDQDEALFLSDDFKTHFGFDSSGPYHSGHHMADHTFDVNVGSHLIYVYCDIASYTLVGNAKMPLLRVCSISGKYGEMIRTIFTHPHYVPVARREIETIEININNELGRPMPFVFGKSVVTLHFKRKHKLLSPS
jgi:hypothetical protein